ncbi:uncharacterized protein LOC115229063 [Octopus sinensis]|uniref:Uncharacterized protein LOC115229063 n=1 Tax=Octopus sinensis TaxID=2607531 RepID=A0A6P7TUA6_9MOLL|nr:uncharacterized protein LOC115229063 [Octopus sinensis]
MGLLCLLFFPPSYFAPAICTGSSDFTNPIPSPDPFLLNPESVLRLARDYRASYRIPIRIPRSARFSAAKALSALIESVICVQSIPNWNRLFCFAIFALGSPVQGLGSVKSLSSSIKENINKFMEDSFILPPLLGKSHEPTTLKDNRIRLRKRVNSCLMAHDVGSAVRILSSSDSVRSITPDVLKILSAKHPAGDVPAFCARTPEEVSIASSSVQQLLFALKSFRGNSSGGVDGLRPIHLMDLISNTAEAGNRLSQSIAKLCNLFLRGDISEHARLLFFSANLSALGKKDGGIRPIAVGNVFCRLFAKVGCKLVIPSISDELQPIQLGVGVPGGCEASVHAARCFIESARLSERPQLLLKLDVKNAFNSLNRKHLLEVCKARIPSLLPFIFLSYGNPSLLVAGDSFISSSCGVQQGDPLGPLLFALSVDFVARRIASPLNIWYLDDCTIGGPPDILLNDLQSLLPALSSIGLEINSLKSEIVNLNVEDLTFEDLFAQFRGLLPDLRQTSHSELEILGAPIHHQSVSRILDSKRNALASLCDKLVDIDPHPAFFILKNFLLIRGSIMS